MPLAMPEQLRAELQRMKRDPREFAVLRKMTCKFCGTRTAFELGHAATDNAGSFCPVHGWVYFNSVKIPPVDQRHARKVKRAA
jgi:hypothetical protein